MLSGTVGAGKTATQRRELWLLPGAGGGSPARRGVGGEWAAFLFRHSFSSSLYGGCCPAWAAGRLPGVGHGVRGEGPSLIGCGAARAPRKKRGFSLCLGADVCSRSRQSVSFFKGNTLLPAPPYSPFCGNAKAVSLAGLYLVRRVSRGRRRSVRPLGVRDRLRARAIAAIVAWVEGGTLAGGRQRRADGQGELRAAKQCRPARIKRKKRVFSVKGQAVWFEP